MECFYAQSFVLHVCHATGINSVGGMYPVVKDIEGLIKDSEWARSMGFIGRSCIHPSHVEPINKVFNPKPKQMEWAKRVAMAIKEERKKRYGEVTLDGLLIGPPHDYRGQAYLRRCRSRDWFRLRPRGRISRYRILGSEMRLILLR